MGVRSPIGGFLLSRLLAATLAVALIGAPERGNSMPLVGEAAGRAAPTPILQVAQTTSAPARLPRPRPSADDTAPASQPNAAAPEPPPSLNAETATAGSEIAPANTASVGAEPQTIPVSDGEQAVASAEESEGPPVSVDSATPAPPADDQVALAPMPQARPTEPGDAADPAAPPPSGSSSGLAAPLPKPRPEISNAEAARLLALQFYGFAPDFVLRAALDSVSDGRYADARAEASKHPDPLVRSLVEWLIARQPNSGMSAAKIIEVLQSHRGWPEEEALQLRAEQAFHAFGPRADSVVTFYGQVEPLTIGGRMALAGALREAGRREEATAIARTLWRQWSLAPGQAAALVTRFGSVLTREDHLYRFQRLVLRKRTEDAATQAQLLGSGYDKLATAVIAVLTDRKEARQLLRGVAKEFLGDPLYVFARVHLLLRSNQPIEAARFLIGSQPDLDLSGDGDIWWEERKDLSRELLDRGVPDLAYRVVADARPEGEGDRVAAAFHAGWYALRFLDDPMLAEAHFRELHILATLPRTQARASYWLGRTHEAEGRDCRGSIRLRGGRAVRRHVLRSARAPEARESPPPGSSGCRGPPRSTACGLPTATS